jgi:hypothetical protein
MATVLAPFFGITIPTLLLWMGLLASLPFAIRYFRDSKEWMGLRLCGAIGAMMFAWYSYYLGTRGAANGYDQMIQKAAPSGQVQAALLSLPSYHGDDCKPLVRAGGVTGLEVLVIVDGDRVWLPAVGGQLQVRDCQAFVILGNAGVWLQIHSGIGW